MESPKIPTEAKDEELNFTFRVLAYRELTPTEFRQTYLLWRRQAKKNKPKKNQIVTIISLIGL
jgi:hypothetical protein